MAFGWGDALGFVGGLLGDKATTSANNSNIALQKEMAQKGIQWRVEDAKAAGISPLAALGAQTSSPTIGVMANTSVANAVSKAGQALSDKKINDLNAQLLESQIKNNNAQSTMYLAEAQRANSQASNVNQGGAMTMPFGWETWLQGPSVQQQEVEDAYGGVVGEAYGIGRFGQDLSDRLKRRIDKLTPAQKDAWAKSYKDSLYRKLY
jgi:hypothetical protein